MIEHPTQTAAMLEPYLVEEDGRWVPGPSRGPTYFAQPVLDGAVAALDAAGWQVHVHAIGDRATRSALDAFEHARDRNGASGLRHTIAHMEVVDPADIARLGPLGVLAEPPAPVGAARPVHGRPPRAHLGADRWQDLYPAGALEAAGATLCGGSDWPVDPLRPFAQLETAVTRTSAGRHGAEEPLFPAQAITLRAALEMHTSASAFQLHQEALTGRIAPGLAADLIVLDRDLLAIPVGEIARTGVELTMIGGRIVHRA